MKREGYSDTAILRNARAYEIFTRRMEIDVHPSKRILSPVALLRTARKTGRVITWTRNVTPDEYARVIELRKYGQRF